MRSFEAGNASLPGILQPDASMCLRSTSYQHLQQSNQIGMQTRQSLVQQLVVGSSEQSQQSVIRSSACPPIIGTQAAPPIMGAEAAPPIMGAEAAHLRPSSGASMQSHSICQAFHQGLNLDSTPLCSQRLPFDVEFDLGKLLDAKHPLGNDWRRLASKFGMSIDDIHLLESKDEPTSKVLSYISANRNTYARDIIKVLQDIKRPDAAEIIERYLHAPSPDTSAGGSPSSGYSS